ncbi:hypothetical protein M407DRAFT_208701 [Tulasnella calospora MUT 4182]|uniref:Uncharacterized protein n=1 Tax=Tulasnella calospora MUT 4182 TaxID=1051891 RepID=A0A0C3PMP7_9AGAM|nr:hypothetical protein M407DRAFT_208701 [Tulasnella calospora MUT 4182]
MGDTKSSIYTRSDVLSVQCGSLVGWWGIPLLLLPPARWGKTFARLPTVTKQAKPSSSHA